MHALEPGLQSRLAEMLARREAELRASLGHPVDASGGEAEVMDFKDLAAADMQSKIDDARTEETARALALVIAARVRIAQGRYGTCLACDEPIGEARLLAQPEALCCLACQAAQEETPSIHA